ncbi:MAG: hypothetical protein JO112_04195, partial [Planctomycetes bacterium]|nr:hypothetical protein [Planctomycetota bacterium]
MTSAESKAPSDGDVGPTFGPWSPRRLFMVLILAICFTSWTVQFSRQHGRLISPPQYDDVVYMNDGADRLEELYVHGFSGLIRSCYRNPPHSPFSTFVAAVSFGIFGLQEWAPYAGNVLVVFFLIGFADRLLQGCHAVVHGLGLAVVFLLPLTQFAVFEFRPDFFAGLLIASGVVSLLATSFVVAPFRHRLLIGVVFGLAFLAKPPLCPFTAVMLLLSVGLGILCEQLLHRPGFWKAVARGSQV